MLNQTECNLNEAVAKFLGYTDVEISDYGCLVGMEPGRGLTRVPLFSEDLAEAMRLCPTLNSKGYTLSIEQRLLVSAPIWVARWRSVHHRIQDFCEAADASLAKAITAAAILVFKHEQVLQEEDAAVSEFEAATSPIVTIGEDAYILSSIRRVSTVREATTVGGEKLYHFTISMADVRDPILISRDSYGEADSLRSALLHRLRKFYNHNK